MNVATLAPLVALLTACGAASDSKQSKGEQAPPSSIRACYLNEAAACLETKEGTIIDAKECNENGGSPMAVCPQENVSQQCAGDDVTTYRYGWKYPC